MRRMQIIIRFLAVVGLVTATTSCGTAVRTGSAPMFLSIDNLAGTRGAAGSGGTASSLLISDVLTIVTTGGTCSTVSPCPTIFDDTGTATLSLVPKNPISGPSPSSTNEVTISRIHVAYRRTDGRNTPGVDVPFPYDTFVTQVVPTTGAAKVSFELVRVQAKQEPPLIQLVSNGQVIAVACDITFFGQDRAGNEISATGSIQAQFSNWGDF